MLRNTLLSSLALLAFSAATAAAQEAGGVELSREVMNTPNAQEQVVGHVVARLQLQQQLRAVAASSASSGAGANVLQGPSDASTSGGPSSAQQAIFAAQQMRMRRAQMAQMDQPIPVAPPVTVVNNSYSGPVAIGNNNQLVTSTVSGGGTAVATASGGQSHSSATSQSARSKATSSGGNAQAVAINSSTVGQGDNR